jgi:hypothetical protein
MNKILPIILVVVLSGCAGSAMQQMQKWNNIWDAAYEKCRQDESTMVGYVHCFHKTEIELQNKHIEGLPWFTSESAAIGRYMERRQIHREAKQYHLVIAEEVDSGRASRAIGELEIQKVTQLLFDKTELKKQGLQNEQFQRQLQFLDIYSKAIERTTPKSPQTIIVPKY